MVKLQYNRLQNKATILIILIVPFLLYGCMGSLTPKRSQVSKPNLVLNDYAKKQFSRLYGNWRLPGSRALYERSNPNKSFTESAQLHFSENGSWMRVLGPVSGVVKLHFEGMTSKHARYDTDSLVFSFKPIKIDQMFSTAPILNAGKIIVTIEKTNGIRKRGVFLYKNDSDNGSWHVGSLLPPIYLNQYITSNNALDSKNQIIRTLEGIKARENYRCYREAEYVIGPGETKTIHLPHGSGETFYLIYSPDDLTDIAMYTGYRYIPKRTNGGIRIKDRFWRSAASGGAITLEHFPSTPNFYGGNHRRIKLLVLRHSFDTAFSGSSCSAEFRTPLFDKKWIAYGHILIALIENKIGSDKIFNDPLLDTVFRTSIFWDRNRRLTFAFKSLFPHRPKSELGYITAIIPTLARGDLAGLPDTVITETIFQELKKSAKGNKEAAELLGYLSPFTEVAKLREAKSTKL